MYNVRKGNKSRGKDRTKYKAGQRTGEDRTEYRAENRVASLSFISTVKLLSGLREKTHIFYSGLW